MPDSTRVPDATVYRLSLYHCLLGEMLRQDPRTKVTSSSISSRLEIREETVRRDISFIGAVGRPGSGYEADKLFGAIQEFLGLEDEYPVVRVGSAEMLRALNVVFPASAYGVRPIAYYSESHDDVGQLVDGVGVRHISEITRLDPGLAVRVALVACAPSHVQEVVDSCAAAGITGILLLTPVLDVVKPSSMRITHVRMPCDIKSLACRCAQAPGEDG